MTNITSDVRNYFKLELLIARSYVVLRQLFKNRYCLFNGGKIWDDSQTCGINYSTSVIAKNKNMNLTPVQKTSVTNGDSNEWDLTTLTALLLNNDRPKTLNTTEIQKLDDEDKLLKELKGIRNDLAHIASKSITDVEFNKHWTKLSAILIAFGDVESELDKLKDDAVFDACTQSINEENVKEALRLNSLATHAHKDGKFSDAITLFTKATVLSGVSDHDRAVFFSNMSSSRLALYEQQPDPLKRFEIDDPTDQRYRALRDAKQSRILWPTWWKGHFRVGKIYAALNEHEKAINSLERALAIAPTNNEILKALDESRQIHTRQSREEHLDPRLKPRTMPEQLNELQEKMGVDPQKVRLGHSLAEEIYPSGADVVKAHKYEHGDIDVKKDYEQAAKYFAKAASQGNAEGMYNLARLTDRGLGVKKDHDLALKLFEQAAAQPPQHPIFKVVPNLGVAESEHALGLRYIEGIGVHKNLSTAAYWYQRAVDHGSAQSANNLALMYLNGTGFDKNLDKAEELLRLSSRRGDPNAMLTLAELLLDRNDFHMAKIWYDRACESGNITAQINRNMFEKAVQHKQHVMNSCPADVLQAANAIKNIIDSLKISKTAAKQSNHIYLYGYDALNEYANRGSITAKRLCNALEHFMEVLNILTQFKILTEQQEDTFVCELSQCYRIEHIVAQIPGLEMRQRTAEIVDRVLRRCDSGSNAGVSRLDEDARVCYAVLHIDSHELIVKFLGACKQKYPKSIYFFELSASVNGWLGRYETTLYDANTGLVLDPNYCELLYDKAVALRLLDKDMNEAIEAYQTFLTIAPKDHRKVPESFYAMASCYFVRHIHDGVADIVKKTYQQGEEAEKRQLPCFLPYHSNNKTLLKPVFDPKSLLKTEPVLPPLNRKARLTDPHRIEVIKQHREREGRILQEKSKPEYNLISQTHKPRVQQQTAKSLIGLKPISLREIDPTKDHVYDGHVLSVTIIEEACSWIPSIHLVIEDEHLDCERMFIYGFPEGQGEYLTREVFTIGSKMSIINPYLRLGANDMRSLIRVDDFSSIMMQCESERVVNMCRCCGEPNASHVCSKCEQARYCSEECRTMDSQLYKHQLICHKQ
jgi:TPR repeat protein